MVRRRRAFPRREARALFFDLLDEGIKGLLSFGQPGLVGMGGNADGFDERAIHCQ